MKNRIALVALTAAFVTGICVCLSAADPAGNVYISDTVNNVVRMIPAADGMNFGQFMFRGAIYTIAGDGAAGFGADGVSATTTSLNQPEGAIVDPNGNLVFADGHAKHRKYRSLRSGEFGLVPDQLWSPTNELKPDGGSRYIAAF